MSALDAILAPQAGEPWWLVAAREARAKGHYREISERRGQGLYLARFWLTPAKASGGGDFESSESVMLHYFNKPDDDGAQHDHPWDFLTTVLCGWYDEALPAARVRTPGGLGPRLDELVLRREAGATVRHAASDLHAVVSVDPGTWTLVRTGNRYREWGFHPPGKPWVPWRQFLGIP